MYLVMALNLMERRVHNAHSRRIYVGDCFVPGFFWHKTSAGINVALAVIVRARILHEVAPERFVSLESH